MVEVSPSKNVGAWPASDSIRAIASAIDGDRAEILADRDRAVSVSIQWSAEDNRRAARTILGIAKRRDPRSIYTYGVFALHVVRKVAPCSELTLLLTLVRPCRSSK